MQRPYCLAQYAATKQDFSPVALRTGTNLGLLSTKRGATVVFSHGGVGWWGLVRLSVTSSRCPSKAWQSNAHSLFLPTYCLVSLLTLRDQFSILLKLQEPYSQQLKELSQLTTQTKYNGRQNRRYEIPPSAQHFSTNAAF